MTPTYASAVAAYVQAGTAGVPLRVRDGRLLVHAAPPVLLAKLGRHKVAVIAILAGDRCRHCGGAIEWREPGAVAFADGTGAHVPCYEAVGGAPLAALGTVP